MKRSTLKANQKAAESLWANFQRINNEELGGKQIFRRVELENGFKVTRPVLDESSKKYLRDENGKVVRTTVFSYCVDGVSNVIEWDEYVTI